jgi:dihydrofolate reductase
MGQVISGMSMSLDGYVTGPRDSRKAPLGEGGEVLHEWIFGARSAADGALLDEMIAGVGAIVMGRRSYDFCEGEGGWGNGGPAGQTPCFVLTHVPPSPDKVVAPQVFTFVTDGIGSAIEHAQAVAGDKTVGLHGSTAVQQGLLAGLVDEVMVTLVPVLLGGGVRLFDHLDEHQIRLERTELIETPAATHLRFRVLK